MNRNSSYRPNGEAELEQAIAVLKARGLKPHKSGDGWLSRCPTHDDKHESLSLDVSKSSGNLLLNCHAGRCSFTQIRDSLGIDATRPPADEPARSSRRSVRDWRDGMPSGHKITAAYAYTDEAGVELYRIVRLDPKSFRPRIPNPEGGWFTTFDGERRVLYYLPEILKAVELGDTVYVVEGEKAAERLKEAGVVATCQANGAGKDWTPELVEPLAGAHVVIVADHDEPGHKSASRLYQTLQGVAASVQLREPATGIDKDGADDHLDAGHTLDELLDLEPLVFGTETEDETTQTDDEETTHSLGVTLLDLDDLLRNPPPDPDYDWHGYLERGTLAVLHGDGGLGKSLIGMGLCRRYTLGKEWLGQVTSGGFALYLDGENSLAEIARRLYSFEVRPGERRLKYGRVDMPILLDPDDGEELLERLVIETGAELIVLDSQRALWGGDEREALEVRPMYQMLARVAERLTVSILLIHHDNKSGLYSGSTDINAAVTSRLHLERYSAKDKKDRRRTLWHEKSRSGPELDEVTFTVDKTLDGRLTFTIEDDGEAIYPREVVDIEERKAPATAIAEYVRNAPSSRLKPATIKERFGISETTLRGRREALESLGIRYVSRGKESYYHAPPQVETLGESEHTFPDLDPKVTPNHPKPPHVRPRVRPQSDPAETPNHPTTAGFPPTEGRSDDLGPTGPAGTDLDDGESS